MEVDIDVNPGGIDCHFLVGEEDGSLKRVGNGMGTLPLPVQSSSSHWRNLNDLVNVVYVLVRKNIKTQTHRSIETYGLK